MQGTIASHSRATSSRISLAVCLVLLPLTLACEQTPQPTPDTRAADEAAVRKLDDEWSKAGGTKDVEKTISYYSDDGIIFPPNAPLITGKEPIRAFWKGMFGAPGFTGGWKATKVDVARSSDLAYVSGTYDFTANDATGKPATDHGKFVEVWKKQADGSWKCVVDIFNSDLPLAAPTETKTGATEKSK